MKRAILPALLATGLLVGGCGNSEDEEAKAAISTYLADQQDQQGEQRMLELSDDEADCVAGDMVDGIGVDQLKEYGLLNDDMTVNENAESPKMSEEDSKTMVDAVFDCTDIMTTMREQLEKSLGEQPQEVKDCFDENLTEDSVRGMLQATFAGDQQKASQELLTPLMTCATTPGQQPQDN